MSFVPSNGSSSGSGFFSSLGQIATDTLSTVAQGAAEGLAEFGRRDLPIFTRSLLLDEIVDKRGTTGTAELVAANTQVGTDPALFDVQPSINPTLNIGPLEAALIAGAVVGLVVILR